MKHMMEMLAKTMKEKGKKIQGPEKDAKMSVLKEIKKMASDDMGEDIKGLKKVTVAAPDESSLKQGLDKAKEIVDKGSLEKNMAEAAEEASDPFSEVKEEEKEEESASEEAMDIEKMDLSEEEIEMLMKILERKKAEKERS